MKRNELHPPLQIGVRVIEKEDFGSLPTTVGQLYLLYYIKIFSLFFLIHGTFFSNFTSFLILKDLK